MRSTARYPLAWTIADYKLTKALISEWLKPGRMPKDLFESPVIGTKDYQLVEREIKELLEMISISGAKKRMYIDSDICDDIVLRAVLARLIEHEPVGTKWVIAMSPMEAPEMFFIKGILTTLKMTKEGVKCDSFTFSDIHLLFEAILKETTPRKIRSDKQRTTRTTRKTTRTRVIRSPRIPKIA